MSVMIMKVRGCLRLVIGDERVMKRAAVPYCRMDKPWATMASLAYCRIGWGQTAGGGWERGASRSYLVIGTASRIDFHTAFRMAFRMASHTASHMASRSDFRTASGRTAHTSPRMASRTVRLERETLRTDDLDARDVSQRHGLGACKQQR